MTEPAEHLADVLDGRAVPADGQARAMANLAASVATLPLASAPAAGWSQLDERFARIVAGAAKRRWYEGWGLGGRPRPLVQRLAAGAMLLGIAGGAGSAATGVTPGEALQSAGDATAGIVRYVTRDDGGPGPLSQAPGATGSSTPSQTTPAPATTPEPNGTPEATAQPSASPAAPTTASAVPPPAKPGTTTHAAGDAGTVTLTSSGTTLTLASTQPATGWTASGDEDDDTEKVEVTFTNGDREVEFKAELKDGTVSVETSSDGGDD